MESFVSITPPDVSVSVIGQVLTKFYSLKSLDTLSVKRLYSWGDLNYYFQYCDGEEFVLKIIKQNDPSNSPEVIKSIADVMKFLNLNGYKCSCPIDTVNKEPVLVLRESVLLHGLEVVDSVMDEESTTIYTAMVLNYVKGKIAAGMPSIGSHMLHAIGGYFGSMDKTLLAFKNTIIMKRQYHKYDLKYLPSLRSFLHIVTSDDDKQHEVCLGKIIDMYESHVVPMIPILSQGIIHNDGNMKNIIVSEDESFIEGVIDFGDCIHSCHIFELAILMANAFSHPFCVHSVRPLVSGYIEAFTLPRQDMQLLYYVVLGRLAQIYINGLLVCNSNAEHTNSCISEELLPNVWSLAEYLIGIPKIDFDSILCIN